MSARCMHVNATETPVPRYTYCPDCGAVKGKGEDWHPSESDPLREALKEIVEQDNYSGFYPGGRLVYVMDVARAALNAALNDDPTK